MPVLKSTEFPGIGFEYDPTQQPFFKALVKENLRKLKMLSTGNRLLEAIASAAPGVLDKAFPDGVNVAIKPPLSRQFSAPGLAGGLGGSPITMGDQVKYDGWYYGKGGKLMPSINAKVQAQELDKKAASLTANGWPGAGCHCYVFYSNTEILSKDGTWFVPYITLGHELIHCFHYLTGTTKPDWLHEEYATVGIGVPGPFTENELRKEAGLPGRTSYG